MAKSTKDLQLTRPNTGLSSETFKGFGDYMTNNCSIKHEAAVAAGAVLLDLFGKAVGFFTDKVK